MLSITLKRDQLPDLFSLGKTEAKNALFRATLQTTNQTANQAAKLIGKETRTAYRAILRGFSVTLPKKNAADMKGTIHAKTGDFIPLAGSRMRVRFVEKVPKNYRETPTVRRYQLISVRMFGKSTWTEIKGAFRAQLIGGNQKKIAEAKKEAAKTGRRVPGRRHVALLMRRSDKRLPLRELFTNQPDMALYLNKHTETIQTYAQKTLDAKISEEIKFRQIRQAKKQLK